MQSQVLSLFRAVERFKQETGAPSNSYDWYKRSAKLSGRVMIGKVGVPTFRVNGYWKVQVREFEDALEEHRRRMGCQRTAEKDLARGIVTGAPGDIIETESGGYRNYNDFYFRWSSSSRVLKDSDGSWFCRHCNAPAGTKHDKEQCHQCMDWNGCSQDCTLSQVFCATCGVQMKV